MIINSHKVTTTTSLHAWSAWISWITFLLLLFVLFVADKLNDVADTLEPDTFEQWWVVFLPLYAIFVITFVPLATALCTCAQLGEEMSRLEDDANISTSPTSESSAVQARQLRSEINNHLAPSLGWLIPLWALALTSLILFNIRLDDGAGNGTFNDFRICNDDDDDDDDDSYDPSWSIIFCVIIVTQVLLVTYLIVAGLCQRAALVRRNNTDDIVPLPVWTWLGTMLLCCRNTAHDADIDVHADYAASTYYDDVGTLAPLNDADDRPRALPLLLHDCGFCVIFCLPRNSAIAANTYAQFSTPFALLTNALYLLLIALIVSTSLAWSYLTCGTSITSLQSVFIALYIGLGLVVLTSLVAFIDVSTLAKARRVRSSFAYWQLTATTIFISLLITQLILIANRIDDNDDDYDSLTSWHSTLIPIYIGLSIVFLGYTITALWSSCCAIRIIHPHGLLIPSQQQHSTSEKRKQYAYDTVSQQQSHFIRTLHIN